MSTSTGAGRDTPGAGQGAAWVSEHGAHLMDYAASHLASDRVLPAVASALAACLAEPPAQNVGVRGRLFAVLRRDCLTAPGHRERYVPDTGPGMPDEEVTERVWSLVEPLGTETLRLMYRHGLATEDLSHVLAMPVEDVTRLATRTQDLIEILASGLDALANRRRGCQELEPLVETLFPEEEWTASRLDQDARASLLSHMVKCPVCARPINIRYTVPQMVSHPRIRALTAQTRRRLLESLPPAADQPAPARGGAPSAPGRGTSPSVLAAPTAPPAATTPAEAPGRPRPAASSSSGSSSTAGVPPAAGTPKATRPAKSSAPTRAAKATGSSAQARPPKASGSPAQGRSPSPDGPSGATGSPAPGATTRTGEASRTGGDRRSAAGEATAAQGPTADARQEAESAPPRTARQDRSRLPYHPVHPDRADRSDSSGHSERPDLREQQESQERPGRQGRQDRSRIPYGPALRDRAAHQDRPTLPSMPALPSGPSGTAGPPLAPPVPGQDTPLYDALFTQAWARGGDATTTMPSMPSVPSAATGRPSGDARASAAKKYRDVEEEESFGGAGVRFLEAMSWAGERIRTTTVKIMIIVVAGGAGTLTGMNLLAPAITPEDGSLRATTAQEPAPRGTAPLETPPETPAGTAPAETPSEAAPSEAAPSGNTPADRNGLAARVRIPPLVTLDEFGQGNMLLTVTGPAMRWRISAPGLVVSPSSGTSRPGHPDVITLRALRIRHWCGTPFSATAPLTVHGPDDSITTTVRWQTC
ncbi:hypothetical protein [Streptosporangium carneum]|uniref:Uncharacterized protein n=1 Tax=Streptosporangium carneum TaxID=47481 RepID=A0A9W6HVH3_9ACTN|nr:hypothetical protein [Streptosporangium carneum]GLK06787.1 hypothetical protein GCM10017600_01920 [Streptosporangium carneum]